MHEIIAITVIIRIVGIIRGRVLLEKIQQINTIDHLEVQANPQKMTQTKQWYL